MNRSMAELLKDIVDPDIGDEAILEKFKAIAEKAAVDGDKIGIGAAICFEEGELMAIGCGMGREIPAILQHALEDLNKEEIDLVEIEEIAMDTGRRLMLATKVLRKARRAFDDVTRLKKKSKEGAEPEAEVSGEQKGEEQAAGTDAGQSDPVPPAE